MSAEVFENAVVPSVLHVGLEDPRVRIGGLNRYLDQLSTAQRSAGEIASRVWISPDESDGDHAVAPGLNWPTRLRRFARAIRSSDAEVIDVHFAAHASWALASGAFRSRPMVVHFQGPWASESAMTGDGALSVRAKARLEGFVLRRATTVVTLSDAFRKIAIERYNVEPRRVRVVAPGVARVEGFDRLASRARRGVSESEWLVVAVRRLVPRMGLDRAIRDFVSIRRDSERLVIVGDGPARAELEAIVDELGASAWIHFAGTVADDELADWYAAADVTIVPSVANEGYGLVVLESLSYGTPVIVSDVDGLRDAGRALSCVQVIDWNAHSLRTALDAVADDNDARVRAVRDAASHSWSAVSDQHREIYLDALTGTAPREVVVLDHTARRSGGELAIARMISGLDPRRWVAHVILAEHGPLEAELADRGISFEVIELDERTRSVSRDDVTSGGSLGSLTHVLTYSARVRRVLRRRAPHVVHTNSMKAHLYGTFASIGASWASVMHVRDQWAPPYVSAKIAKWLHRLARFGPDAVVANSAATAATVRVPATVLASPLEREFFEVPPAEYSEVVRLAVIGRLAPWKGQDLAIRAVAALPPSLHWRLSIAGDALFGEDDYAQSLRDLVNELAVGDRVDFLGHVDDVTSLLADTDVCLLTSKSPEPFGNVVAEAMAAGRTVIVPNRGGVTEFVSENGPFGSGFFYEIDDVNSLTAALARVAADPQLRTHVGDNARRAVAQFSVTRLARVLESLYDDLT